MQPSLVVLMGVPACGKDYWINFNNLEPYTISPDIIRLMIQNPCITQNGVLGISQKNNNQVWELVYKFLEGRMQRGDFTIINCTSSKLKDLMQFANLVDVYKYKFYVLDFSDVPLEVCKQRNRDRADYKFVPEFVLDGMYNRIKNINLSALSNVQVIKPDNFWEVFDRKDFV